MLESLGSEGLIMLSLLMGMFLFISTSIGLFLLRGFGLKTLIRNNNLGEDKVVLGFIPFISDYLLEEVTSGKKSYKENTLGSITFGAGIISFIFGFLSIVYAVLYLILCHKFFKAVNPENYVLLNILNVVSFGSFSYIYIFIKRNFVFNYVNNCVSNSNSESDLNTSFENENSVNLSK